MPIFSTPRRIAALLRFVCTECQEWHTAISMRKHIFVIHGRGKPLSIKRFCSLECVALYIEKVDNSRELRSESFSHETDERVVHRIKIRKKKDKKVQTSLSSNS